MSRFQFDPTPSPGANRGAARTDCDVCDGHRMVEVEENVYRRCEKCNPEPASETAAAPDDAWWKQ